MIAKVQNSPIKEWIRSQSKVVDHRLNWKPHQQVHKIQWKSDQSLIDTSKFYYPTGSNCYPRPYIGPYYGDSNSYAESLHLSISAVMKKIHTHLNLVSNQNEAITHTSNRIIIGSQNRVNLVGPYVDRNHDHMTRDGMFEPEQFTEGRYDSATIVNHEKRR